MKFNMESFIPLPSYLVLTKDRLPISDFEYKVIVSNENNVVLMKIKGPKKMVVH